MPLAQEDSVISPGKHVVTVQVDNVFAFGDYRVNMTLQNESERLTLRENALRFHIKGFAAQVMSVVNPDRIARIIIE